MCNNPARMDRRHSRLQNAKLPLLLVIGVLPLALTATTTAVSFDRAQEVEFCASCHVMEPYSGDLRDPASGSLASAHFKNRWIAQRQCYGCHADYGFLGPVETKIRAMRHTAAWYFGDRSRPPRLYKPFPNQNCLRCHSGARSFEAGSTHAEVRADLESGATSCLECHGPVHDVGARR